MYRADVFFPQALTLSIPTNIHLSQPFTKWGVMIINFLPGVDPWVEAGYVKCFRGNSLNIIDSKIKTKHLFKVEKIIFMVKYWNKKPTLTVVWDKAVISSIKAESVKWPSTIAAFTPLLFVAHAPKMSNINGWWHCTFIGYCWIFLSKLEIGLWEGKGRNWKWKIPSRPTTGPFK